MPECGIGLVPDVGGSFLLALAPGRIGEYLGTTGARMGPADAILAGFADLFIPEDRWEALKTGLVDTGDVGLALSAVAEPPLGRLTDLRPEIDALFAGRTAGEIRRKLRSMDSHFASETLTAFDRAAPLSVSVCVEMLHRLRKFPDMQRALELEYRFTYRAMAHADFIEGIRAAIIDKDRKPRWRHASAEKVSDTEVAQMLAPLGTRTLRFDVAA
jgi:enoyl-CoA hydratase/carnithine racemase